MEKTDSSPAAEGRGKKRLAEEGSKTKRSAPPSPATTKKAKVTKGTLDKYVTAKKGLKGKNSASEGCSNAANSRVNPALDFNLEDRYVNRLFQFIRSVATGDITPADAANDVRKRFGGIATSSTLSFRILDIIAFMLDFPNYKQPMERLLSELERAGVVTSREIVAAIDANKLDDCGYSTGLTTISIRERTRKQFVLTSYGLWRECTVGYDVLRQLLYNQDWATNDAGEMAKLRKYVKYVAGKYSLCPARVLYELVTWCSWHDGDAMILVLQQYPSNRIVEVISQILSQQHAIKRECQVYKRLYWRVPDMLGCYFFNLCARLLADGSMELGKLYKYLEPADAQLTNLSSSLMEAARKKSVKLERNTPPVTCLIPIANSNSGDATTQQMVKNQKNVQPTSSDVLNSTTINIARDMINARHARLLEQLMANEKMNLTPRLGKESLSSTKVHSELQQDNSEMNNKGGVGTTTPRVGLGTSPRAVPNGSHAELVDLVKYDFLKDDTYAYIRDHIFALECEKLTLLSLLIGMSKDMESETWKVAILFMRHLQITVKFHVILHGKVSMALCAFLSRLITKHLSESRLDVCLSTIENILEILGPGLYLDLVCLSKTIKVLDMCLYEYPDRVCDVIWLYIFPSMALLVEGNCQVNGRLWSILSRLPASKRYWIYHMYTSNVLNVDPNVEVASIHMVKAAHNGAAKRTRSIFKRVTSTLLKSTKSAHVRSSVSIVSGLASVDPFAVSHTIITQCEMFENLLLPLSEIGKYFGHLACDVLFFKLCATQNQVCFNSNSESDEIGLSKRLSVNTQLCARFFRRHASSDLCPILIGVLTIFLRSMMKTSLDVVTQGQGEGTPSKENVNKKSIPLTAIKTKSNWSYPDDVSPGWLVVEYVCRLMEVAGGVPQLAEAHALTTDQLNAQAGGVILRSEIMTQEPDDETCGTSSREALARMLLRPLFCHGLLLLSGKMRLEVLYDSDFRGSVMSLCATVDRLQKVALQLGEFKENVNVMLARNEDSHASSRHSLELPPIYELRRFWEEATAIYLVNSSRQPPSHQYAESTSPGPFKSDFLDFITKIHLPDIWVPTEQYRKTLQRLEEWIKDGGSGHSSGTHRRMKKLRSRHQALEREMKQQVEHVESTKKSFAELLGKGWLMPDAQPGPGITIAFLKHCIVPRVFVNEAEAYFCGRIVDIMLSQRVEYFNFFDFYNCWTKMLMSMVRCCTEREAPLLAIFVNHTFSVIKYWSTRAKEFEEMTRGHPCYCATFKYVPNKALTHSQLLSGIRKWEGRILRALSYALELHVADADSGSQKTDSRLSSPTWIDQKSAVVFLARCHENFPITSMHGKRLLIGLQGVTENAQKNGWKDVHVAASTLVKTFEKYERSKTWL